MDIKSVYTLAVLIAFHDFRTGRRFRTHQLKIIGAIGTRWGQRDRRTVTGRCHVAGCSRQWCCYMRARRRGKESAWFGGHRSLPRSPGSVYLRISENTRESSESIMRFKGFQVLAEWNPFNQCNPSREFHVR